LEAPRLQLRSALLLNGWESRCEVRIEAVSDERGTAHLYSGVHPFSSEASLLPQDGPCEVVPTLRLEDLEIDNVDLVKIDVERAEDRVLEGMRSWLERSPPALIFEMLADGPHAEVQRLLAPFGYVFFRLRAEGPVPVEGLVPAGGEPARNIAALPPDKRDWL
jgi:FkbM family methyltransferase